MLHNEFDQLKRTLLAQCDSRPGVVLPVVEHIPTTSSEIGHITRKHLIQTGYNQGKICAVAVETLWQNKVEADSSKCMIDNRFKFDKKNLTTFRKHVGFDYRRMRFIRTTFLLKIHLILLMHQT
jgi:hypothetical protein